MKSVLIGSVAILLVLCTMATGTVKAGDQPQEHLFGVGESYRGGKHAVGIGRTAARPSPLLAVAEPLEVGSNPRVPLPLQPFTLELLDLKRGQWHFLHDTGSLLELAGPIVAYAFPRAAGKPLRLAYLCSDHEFPGDLDHAVLKVTQPAEDTEGLLWFRIEEPYFACDIMAQFIDDNVVRCELHNIQPGPAIWGDKYVEGLYILVGDDPYLLWLTGDSKPGGLQIRLLTDRVGHVFTEDEPVQVILAALRPPKDGSRTFTLRATDYATDHVVWRGRLRLRCRTNEVARQKFAIPLKRFGVFEISARSGAAAARLRVCRIPVPNNIDPEASAIGINVFQQHTWWYTYQVPLLAKAGVRWIRPWLCWENTWHRQESEPGKWNTHNLDAALRRMEKYSQRYEYLLFRAPEWIAGSTGAGVPPVTKMDQWAEYVARLVSRYRGRIRHYEVWNEPDLMWPEDTRGSGEHYLEMLKATWEAAKRADPDCVIDGLSHSGRESWLHNVGKLGAARYLDVVTIHSYAKPGDFAALVERRRSILNRYNLGHKPLWINEFGTSAYDFSPEYNAKYNCSEQRQATTLVSCYAQALSYGPDPKAFWFCSLDPRDPAHQSQWTGDAGIGILYLGLLPKMSYAALAGVAKQLDGRTCLGRAEPHADLHQVSFEGPLAVVWHDRPTRAGPVPATRLGCLPAESITVHDMFTNELASGPAGEIMLNFSQGALYLEGSQQMAGVARAEQATHVQPEHIPLDAGGIGHIDLTAPPGAQIVLGPQPKLPISAQIREQNGETHISLMARDKAPRVAAYLRVRAVLEPGILGLREPAEVDRWVSVSIGEPNLIRDGAFFAGNLFEWLPDWKSDYSWDPDRGHETPGSLRLDAPFDRRLVQQGIQLNPNQPLKLRAWVKSERLTGCLATFNLALFDREGWLQTWALATSGREGDDLGDTVLVPDAAKMPTGTADWTLLAVTLAPKFIAAQTTRAKFHVDVKGGGTGTLWIDDLDLWQPESEQ